MMITMYLSSKASLQLDNEFNYFQFAVVHNYGFLTVNILSFPFTYTTGKQILPYLHIQCLLWDKPVYMYT